MISSMIGSDDSSRPASRRLKHQKIIIVRFLAVAEDNLDRRLKMEEASRQVGASSRLLRFTCQAHLGLSPLQYLLRRRMDVARCVLQQGNCMVSDVARQFGFRELGRFATSYRKLYGEPPSITLKLASTRILPPSSASRRPPP
jgi:AraC-like DNA-binding protein